MPFYFIPLLLNIFVENAPSTTINLEYTFSTGLSGLSSSQQRIPPAQVQYRSEVTNAYVQPQQATRPPAYRQQTSPPQAQFFNNWVPTGFECGVPDFKIYFSTGLIVKGQTAVRGQFPW